MKKNNVIILVILLMTFNISYGCICGLFWRKWDEKKAEDFINYTDIIFIGELVTYADDCYEFKVIKPYKGNIKKDDIIDGYYKSTCSGYPEKKGKWIFYGQYDDLNENGNSLLDYSQCGPTKNIDFKHDDTNLLKDLEQKYWIQELKLLNRIFSQ